MKSERCARRLGERPARRSTDPAFSAIVLVSFFFLAGPQTRVLRARRPPRRARCDGFRPHLRRFRIVDMWVDVGARSGESGEVARPHCPVRRVHGDTHLGHCHSAGEALRLLPGRFDTRATRGPARRVRGGACAACHPPASLGVASALRAIPLAPAAVDRARAPRERPDLVQICPAGPRVRRFFLLSAPAIDSRRAPLPRRTVR